MKLVPYVLTHKQKGQFTITTLSVFLSHAGRSLWKTEERGLVEEDIIRREYCEANDFTVESISIDKEKQIAYIRVNKEKTNFGEFYTWEEALQKPSKPECWRCFYFIQDGEKVDWFSPKDLIEAELQEFGNVLELYSEILKRSKRTST